MSNFGFFSFFILAISLTCLSTSITTVQAYISSISIKNNVELPNLKAAVIVPGFLGSEGDYKSLASSLTKHGVPTVIVPMPRWHWIPCLDGRSMRPILERIEHTVRHAAALSAQWCQDTQNSEVPKTIPPFEYTLKDLYGDLMNKVVGSSEVSHHPAVDPCGTFLQPEPSSPSGRVALIGHSMGGWVSRIYLSDRSYGGRVYGGSKYVHSLVTLGTPHLAAAGPAFEGVRWANREKLPSSVRGLAVGGVGYHWETSSTLTKNAYAFCCPHGSNGSSYDGDGLTAIDSALALEGKNTDKLALEGATHFPWSDVSLCDAIAPELTKDHREGRLWYGDDEMVNRWVGFLDH